MAREKGLSNMKVDIQEAAKRLFIDKGFSASSMQQIADAAGCTKSVLYHHFKDKEELWNAVKDQVLNPFETSHKDIFADRDFANLDDFLELTVATRFKVYSQSSEVQRMVMWQNLERRGQFKNKHPWIQSIQSLQKRGDIRQDIDPIVVVHMILASGVAGTHSLGPIHSAPIKSSYLDHILKMLKSYLQQQKPSSASRKQ